MTDYNAIATLNRAADPDLADELVDALANYHPAVSNNEYGYTEIIITLPANSTTQAITTALSIINHATQGHTLTGLEVLPTEHFDRRLEHVSMPELMTIPEAATTLGMSRQAVLQKIKAGKLPHRHVGERTYVVAKADIEHLKTPTN